MPMYLYFYHKYNKNKGSSTNNDEKENFLFDTDVEITNDPIRVAELLQLGRSKVFTFPEMKEVTQADIAIS